MSSLKNYAFSQEPNKPQVIRVSPVDRGLDLDRFCKAQPSDLRIRLQQKGRESTFSVGEWKGKEKHKNNLKHDPPEKFERTHFRY